MKIQVGYFETAKSHCFKTADGVIAVSKKMATTVAEAKLAVKAAKSLQATDNGWLFIDNSEKMEIEIGSSKTTTTEYGAVLKEEEV